MLDELARTATSLSCSLGPALGGGLAPLLAGLVRTDVRADAGRLRLYAAENDHAAVQKLAETPQLLGGLDGLPIEVIPLLVDRVCTARTISAGQVDTATEPWAGEIVVMTADDHKLKAAAMNDELGPPSPGAPPSPKALLERRRLLAAPPFSGDGVRWPKSEAEAHLLHRRKILTVNGTHMHVHGAWASSYARHGHSMGMAWTQHGHGMGMAWACARGVVVDASTCVCHASAVDIPCP